MQASVLVCRAVHFIPPSSGPKRCIRLQVTYTSISKSLCLSSQHKDRCWPIQGQAASWCAGLKARGEIVWPAFNGQKYCQSAEIWWTISGKVVPKVTCIKPCLLMLNTCKTCSKELRCSWYHQLNVIAEEFCDTNELVVCVLCVFFGEREPSFDFSILQQIRIHKGCDLSIK